MISKNLQNRIFTSIILITIIFLFAFFDFLFVYGLIVLGVISILEFFNLMEKINYQKFFKILLNTIFIIYISTLCVLFVFFLNFLQLKIQIFILILVCAASDIGGFIFGKIFKGPKLTKISPNKTYSGMIGGYFLSLISLSYFMNWINHEISINWFIVTILLSTVSQIGDIIISYFKRLSKIKNTGKIIPGHGGLLDRIDGMIFVFPTFYIIELMGVLSR